MFTWVLFILVLIGAGVGSVEAVVLWVLRKKGIAKPPGEFWCGFSFAVFGVGGVLLGISFYALNGVSVLTLFGVVWPTNLLAYLVTYVVLTFFDMGGGKWLRKKTSTALRKLLAKVRELAPVPQPMPQPAH